MEFKRVEDDLENMYFFQKRNLESGLTICLWSVLYGTRIRVYFKDSQCCCLDYCGGSVPEHVKEIYSWVEAIITAMTIEQFNRFKWPTQRYKPMYNDPECYSQLRQIAGLNSKVDVFNQENFPDINLMRLLSLSKHFKCK